MYLRVATADDWPIVEGYWQYVWPVWPYEPEPSRRSFEDRLSQPSDVVLIAVDDAGVLHGLAHASYAPYHYAMPGATNVAILTDPGFDFVLYRNLLERLLSWAEGLRSDRLILYFERDQREFAALLGAVHSPALDVDESLGFVLTRRCLRM
jgi:hypothetical protein